MWPLSKDVLKFWMVQGATRQVCGRQIIWGRKYTKSDSAHRETGEYSIRGTTIDACPDLTLPWAFTFSHYRRQDTGLDKSLVCPLTVFWVFFFCSLTQCLSQTQRKEWILANWEHSEPVTWSNTRDAGIILYFCKNGLEVLSDNNCKEYKVININAVMQLWDSWPVSIA